MAVIRVTAIDVETGDEGVEEIWDDYCIVAAGTAEVTNVQVHRKPDGTATHVLTVKGVRRG